MNILTQSTGLGLSDGRKAQKAAHQIEGLFFKLLMKEMQRSLPKGGLMGGGMAAQMAGEMFSQSVAEKLGSSVSLGLSSKVLEQLQLDDQQLTSESSGWPVSGRISSPFGFRNDPVDGQRRFHHGLDIAAPVGSPIHSLTDGLVVHAGPLGGLGQVVKVQKFDGTQFVYGHCSQTSVKVGQQIQRGQKLAEVGSTGRSTSSHLHLEIRADGRSVDPSSWILKRNYAESQVGAKSDDKRFDDPSTRGLILP